MKRYIALAGIVGIILLGLFAFPALGDKSEASGEPESAQAPKAGPQAKPTAAPNAPPAPMVLVEKATRKVPVTKKKYVGIFDPIEKVVSVARVSGYIEQIPFKEGDLIQKDSVLFEIEKIRYEAALAGSKAKVSSCEANIETTKARILQSQSRLDYAKNNYERNKNLYEQGRVVSEDAMENSQSALKAQQAEHKSIEAELLACEASLRGSQAELKLSEDDMRHTTIKSMITGRAGRVNYTVGNYVTPTSGALVTIVQMDPIYLRFSMSEHDFTTLFGNIENLKNEAKIEIKLANGDIYTEEGKISFIDNQMKSATNTIYIWATFKNSKELLNPGGVATVLLSKQEGEEIPAVRASAIMFDGRDHYIYVVKEPHNEVEKRTVEIVSSDGDFTTLRSGVKEGETVIIDGHTPGKIRFIPGMGAPRVQTTTVPSGGAANAPAAKSSTGNTVTEKVSSGKGGVK